MRDLLVTVLGIHVRKRTSGKDVAAIAVLGGVAIGARVLTLAAIAEGLHRRLFDEKKRVPVLKPSDVTQTRRAARQAALDRVREIDRSGRRPLPDADVAEFKQALNDAFSFVNAQTFRSKMADLI
jgi:hypothetical protein